MLRLRGILASLEGISGCGKTFFMTKLHEELRNIPATLVGEIMDRRGEGLDQRIIMALSHTSDRFFRTGLPRSETFLLLALKMFDYETTIAEALDKGKIVVEDRSIDTIAVYQSIILCPGCPDQMVNTANEIYALAAKWRRPPDITFLIEDDFDTMMSRAQKRIGRTFTNDELDILRNAARVYVEYATQHSKRIVRLDRREMNARQIVKKIKRDIIAKAQSR